MAMIMIPLTFDKSHFTKEEKEMSPPCSLFSNQSTKSVMDLAAWMEVLYLHSVKTLTSLHFMGVFPLL